MIMLPLSGQVLRSQRLLSGPGTGPDPTPLPATVAAVESLIPLRVPRFPNSSSPDSETEGGGLVPRVGLA
jgi:hypothetical protein